MGTLLVMNYFPGARTAFLFFKLWFWEYLVANRAVRPSGFCSFVCFHSCNAWLQRIITPCRPLSPAELLRRALTYSSGLPGRRVRCCQVGSWSSGPVAKSSFVCRVFPFLIVTCKFFLKCPKITKGRRNYRSRGHLAGSLGRACDSGCQVTSSSPTLSVEPTYKTTRRSRGLQEEVSVALPGRARCSLYPL